MRLSYELNLFNLTMFNNVTNILNYYTLGDKTYNLGYLKKETGSGDVPNSVVRFGSIFVPLKTLFSRIYESRRTLIVHTSIPKNT